MAAALDWRALNDAGTVAARARAGGLWRPARAIAGDVTDFGRMDSGFGRVEREFGRIDFLGNVAGNARMAPAESMSLEDIHYTFHNLVISRLYTCQQAGRRMLAQGRGSIVSIGSIAGDRSLGRDQTVYGMAMAAVIHMTKELSTEWAGPVSFTHLTLTTKKKVLTAVVQLFLKHK